MRFFAISAVLVAASISSLGAGPRVRRPAKKPSTPPINQQMLRVQVLLDRAHFSPGQIDASAGNITRLMLAAFQTQHGLPATGTPDQATTQALEQDQQSAPTAINYTMVYDDIRGPFNALPATMMAQAKLPALNYQSAWDGLGEKFHCSAALLHRLNPNQRTLKPGDQITVPNIHHDTPQGAASVSVSKASRIVQVLDGTGKPIANYPATIGSQHDPLPIGNWRVTKVEWNPTFYYDPSLFWNANPHDAKAVIKPGPRNPVGVVWIGLDREHYGLHGTPDPAGIGHDTSHGCARLTNWDASEAAQMVSAGMPVVFKE
jgi:lipoprotein-anchoring transpeptidase ErfK/SrfK